MKCNYTFFVKTFVLTFTSFLQLCCEASEYPFPNNRIAAPNLSTHSTAEANRQELIDSINEESALFQPFAKGLLNRIPLARFTPDFKVTVIHLTQGMDGLNKSIMISNLAAIPEARLTPAFEATVTRLTQGMSLMDRSSIVKCLTAISAERLADFEAMVNRFSEGVSTFSKHYMIEALAAIPEGRLTPAFEATVIRLTQGMDGFGKSRMVSALAALPEARLTPAFEATVTRLVQGVSLMDRSSIVKCLTAISAERLADFEAMVNRFSEGVSAVSKHYMIKALAAIPEARLTPAFEATVIRLTQGMDGLDKSFMISALAAVPEERLTPAFEATVTRLVQGMDGPDKSRMICALGVIPAERLADLANITDQTIYQLHQYVPFHLIQNLIRRLANMQPNQWQAEITQVINEYRHGNAGAQPGVAFEVHNYANTQITTSSSSATSSSSSPMRLDDAVMQKMTQRLQVGKVTLLAYVDAKALLEEWIEAKYGAALAEDLKREKSKTRTLEDKRSTVSDLTLKRQEERKRAKHAAFAKLVSDTDYEQVICTAVSFLQNFHLKSVNIWLDGFLTESITAYGNNGESCSKGIRERVATGMRTIDTELDTIFAQAEGPALANKFIGSLNLNNKKRCEEITKELIELGLTINSTAAEASGIFERYMRKSLTSYGVRIEDYAKQLQTMKELVAEEGGFETYIKPILQEMDVSSPANSRKRTIDSAEDHSYPNKRQGEQKIKP